MTKDEIIKYLENQCHWIALNMNDIFGLAQADTEMIEPEHLLYIFQLMDEQHSDDKDLVDVAFVSVKRQEYPFGLASEVKQNWREEKIKVFNGIVDRILNDISNKKIFIFDWPEETRKALAEKDVIPTADKKKLLDWHLNDLGANNAKRDS